MPFPLQTMNENRIHAEEATMQKIVHNAKEQAKQDGCFTAANRAALITELASRLENVSAAEITVEATDMTERKQRGELIYYKVSIPIKNVVAAAKFYGIAPQDNQTVYVIENYTASEWLP